MVILLYNYKDKGMLTISMHKKQIYMRIILLCSSCDLADSVESFKDQKHLCYEQRQNEFWPENEYRYLVV